MNIVSLIIILLFCGSPPTIAGFVVPVIVDSIDGSSFGTLSHVGKEQEEVIAPTITNRDSSGSVQVIMAISWVITSFSHGFPSAIRSIMFTIPVSKTSLSHCRQNFFVNTPAAYLVSSLQIGSYSLLINKRSATTVTNTEPSSPVTCSFRTFGFYDEPSVSLSWDHALLVFHGRESTEMSEGKQG